MSRDRVTNYLLVTGRVGAGILFLAVMCTALIRGGPIDGVTLAFAILCGVAAFVLTLWGLSSPVWIEFDENVVLVKHWNSLNEYQWKELKVLFYEETTETKGIENRHTFAKFRTKAGIWFKVRVNFQEAEKLRDHAKRLGILLQSWSAR